MGESRVKSITLIKMFEKVEHENLRVISANLIAEKYWIFARGNGIEEMKLPRNGW
jgi:hypothetical protein